MESNDCVPSSIKEKTFPLLGKISIPGRYPLSAVMQSMSDEFYRRLWNTILEYVSTLLLSAYSLVPSMHIKTICRTEAYKSVQFTDFAQVSYQCAIPTAFAVGFTLLTRIDKQKVRTLRYVVFRGWCWEYKWVSQFLSCKKKHKEMESVDAGDTLETENNLNGSGCFAQLLQKTVQILQTHQRLWFPPKFVFEMLMVVALSGLHSGFSFIIIQI